MLTLSDVDLTIPDLTRQIWTTHISRREHKITFIYSWVSRLEREIEIYFPKLRENENSRWSPQFVEILD